MVNEEDGFVTICAELIDGVLERMITVYLNSADGTAAGKSELSLELIAFAM